MSESRTDRIAATYNLSEHPAVNASGQAVMYFFLIRFLSNTTFETGEQKVIPFCWLLCIAFPLMILGQLIKLAHRIYFTPEGSEFCRFGRVYARFSWEQISRSVSAIQTAHE